MGKSLNTNLQFLIPKGFYPQTLFLYWFFKKFFSKQILFQVVHDLKLLMKSLGPKLFQQSSCCACGLTNCKESSDHQFISVRDLKNVVKNAKIAHPQLDQIKDKVKEFYKKLKKEILTILQNDSNKIQDHLSRFYYPHINPQKICINQICQISNNNLQRLPNKKIIKIMNMLQDRNDENIPSNDKNEFQQLKQDILSFMTDFQKRNQIDKFKSHILYSSVIEKALPKLKLRRSQSDISNPQEIDQEAVKTYTWKNVTIKNKTKVLELSNKNITDNQLLREMPVISSFKNIKDFQIRHNRITSFSCKIIASNMSHVKSIDIRGNPVGDEGVISIIRGVPHLKSFMISQTKCTNLSAAAIVTGLLDIQMLWYQHNQIDGPHALLIGSLPKLKVLSFAGNGLDPEVGQKLRKIFNSKGYVII